MDICTSVIIIIIIIVIFAIWYLNKDDHKKITSETFANCGTPRCVRDDIPNSSGIWANNCNIWGSNTCQASQESSDCGNPMCIGDNVAGSSGIWANNCSIWGSNTCTAASPAPAPAPTQSSSLGVNFPLSAACNASWQNEPAVKNNPNLTCCIYPTYRPNQPAEFMLSGLECTPQQQCANNQGIYNSGCDYNNNAGYVSSVEYESVPAYSTGTPTFTGVATAILSGI